MHRNIDENVADRIYRMMLIFEHIDASAHSRQRDGRKRSRCPAKSPKNKWKPRSLKHENNAQRRQTIRCAISEDGLLAVIERRHIGVDKWLCSSMMINENT